MQFLFLIVGLVVGGALGALVMGVLARRRSSTGATEDPATVAARHEAEIAQVRAAEQQAQADLRAQVAALQAQAAGLQEQVSAHKEQYREVMERQRTDQQAASERERAQSKILEALAPVRESVTSMREKVTELEKQRSTQHGQLAQQLRTATESEERLRSTAEQLAAALRSNSTRGVWGETQLRSVVEAAGLIERVDFDLQSSINSDVGAGRPDMVVHLPGGKNIAVDAKAPFSAFLEASQIPATATGAEGSQREDLLKRHVKAVRDHITALGSKAYWEGLEASPELVVAFIPSESLVSAAMEADPSIMEFAFEKRVALASPVTLWSVLKTVAFSWQQDVLTHDAKQLFDSSRELYSRLATTANHIEKLGRSLKTTVGDYNKFVGSLERQVLPSARRLGALDESKVIGPMNGVEESPRELTAPELTEELAEGDGEASEALDLSDQTPRPAAARDSLDP